MESTWNQVDAYLDRELGLRDSALDDAMATSAAAGLPPISVTPTQGKLLHLLARMVDARRILELGTLGGYSSIWLGRALPADGEMLSLEIDPSHAAVARHNLDRAGLADRVTVVLGPASDTLAKLIADGSDPFDFIFIDADKARIDAYFEASLRLSKLGTVIVVDNVVRQGNVIDAESEDESVRGVRRLVELLAGESRVSATAVQTVGSKGYDGFILAVVTAQ
jgi:predicted O-methyltransferase YrrM